MIYTKDLLFVFTRLESRFDLMMFMYVVVPFHFVISRFKDYSLFLYMRVCAMKVKSQLTKERDVYVYCQVFRYRKTNALTTKGKY